VFQTPAAPFGGIKPIGSRPVEGRRGSVSTKFLETKYIGIAMKLKRRRRPVASATVNRLDGVIHGGAISSSVGDLV